MNIFDDFKDKIVNAVETMLAADGLAIPDLGRITVEPPKDPSHGDIATNAAMVLAKPLGQKPRDLAERLSADLAKDPLVASADLAGPGFINIRFAPEIWSQFLRSLLAAGNDFGRVNIGLGQKLNVEYVSANPTGPMHVGHARGAVFGDSLANLLAFAGYDVSKEYYINDAGGQIEVLARSVFLRYREALGEKIGTIPEGLYPGDYLKAVGASLAEAHGTSLHNQPEAEWMETVSHHAIAAMMALIRDDLAALNVSHDLFFSERSLFEEGRNRVEDAILSLKNQGDIYVGKLPPPKGQLPDDWEDRAQTLFRSTAYGDDSDRALLKSDGSYTYFANDIAYHYDKFLRGFSHQIDVLGADHGGYVKRMQAAVKAISGGKATLTVKLCQLVKLYRGGVPIKMSKRSGELVTLREVVDEVGIDATRFMMIYRKNDAPLDFDFQAVQEKNRDNPVFYVQYAHARCHSIFRQACRTDEGEENGMSADDWLALIEKADLSRLTHPAEIQLLRKLSEYPRLIRAAATAGEPHRLAFYLYEVASEFHGLWNRGKEDVELRFVNHTDKDLTCVRLSLVHATRLVLASGLGILGVSAPSEMT